MADQPQNLGGGRAARVEVGGRSDGCEYRVVWQREGQAKKRRIYQTLQGAKDCASVQENAHDDMEWLSEPVAEITFGPVIESRPVGIWSPCG